MSAPVDMRRPARSRREVWIGLAKLAVSATLVALVLRRFSWAELRAEFAATHAAALVVPFAIIVACNLLGAAQWRWILRAAGIGLAFGSTAKLYFAGLFLNNFTLGNVGGDVYKIYCLRQSDGRMGRAAGATIVDRVVGLTALCTLAAFAALWELRRARVPVEQAGFVLGIGLVILCTAAILLHPRYGEAVSRRVARLPLGSWSERISRLLGYLGEYRRRSGLLNGVFLLSLVIQAGRVLAHFCVGLAMGWSLHPMDLAKFFLVIPILGLLVSLPISFGGWGVREWAGMALFAPLGHGGQEAVTLLATTAALTLVASLAGSVVLVAGHGVRPERAAA